MIVIDFSWWRPTADQLKAAGVTVVCLYLGYPGLGVGKIPDKGYYDSLIAAGIHVILNWETNGRSWRGGYAAGKREGADARRQADELSYPYPVIQSIDEGVIATMLGSAVAYQQGFNDGFQRGKQGAYGTKFALDRMFDLGLISVGWQTNARGWFLNGADCVRALLFQRTSHPLALPANQYDFDDVNIGALASSPYPFLSASPQPVPIVKVKPMLNPPLAMTWAAEWQNPDGSVKAAVAPNGDVYAFGVPYRPWPTKAKDFAGRQAAQIGQADGLPAGRYTITATSGEKYAP